VVSAAIGACGVVECMVILTLVTAPGPSISKAPLRHQPSAITTHLVPFTLTYQPHREDTMSSHVENLTPAFAPFFGMVSAGPLA
jgi:hypothetical protein